MFEVTVPADFGDQELVWTLTSKGKTETAYGSLRPDYVIDDTMKMKNLGGIGTPLALTTIASDDGIPPPRPAARQITVNYNALGLRVAWFVYRGPGDAVTFEPDQIKLYPDYRGNSSWTPGWSPSPLPEDDRVPVIVTFAQSGTYVLRAMAHDGGLITNVDLNVDVVD